MNSVNFCTKIGKTQLPVPSNGLFLCVCVRKCAYRINKWYIFEHVDNTLLARLELDIPSIFVGHGKTYDDFMLLR